MGRFRVTQARRLRAAAGVVFVASVAGAGGPAHAAPKLKILFSFGQTTKAGAEPWAGPLLNGADLYGTTDEGGAAGNGVVYQVGPAAPGSRKYKETVLHAFSKAKLGTNPQWPVSLDGSGDLYSTTFLGGANGDGLVFELSPPASTGKWVQHVLYSFQAADGARPSSGVTFGASGGLYGTLLEGGPGPCAGPTGVGCGSVYALLPPSSPGGAWRESILHGFAGSFDFSDDGVYPSGQLISEPGTGVLYGTTQLGGNPNSSVGDGTVYSLTPPASADGAWTETVLYGFAGGPLDGANPEAGVVENSAGVLFGTTYDGGATATGGAAGYGTVFMLTPPGTAGGAWTETVLYSFQGGTDGAKPQGGLTLDPSGSGVLYGTTLEGGDATCQCGTIFSLTPPTVAGNPWTETVLWRFTGVPDGADPKGTLAADSKGHLYGTTSGGSQTAFELTL